jgi:hypothetical protein
MNPMIKPKKSVRRSTKFSAPPNPSDAVADAFGKTRREAEAGGAELLTVIESLDAGWDGGPKKRFLESLRTLSGRMTGALLPLLYALEKKYREYPSVNTDDP